MPKAKSRKKPPHAKGLVPVQLWVTPELRTRLKVASARTQWSMSALAMLYLHDGLKAQEATP